MYGQRGCRRTASSPTGKGPHRKMNLALLHGHTNDRDLKKLQHWLEGDKGRCYWNGLAVRYGEDERGIWLRPDETPRPRATEEQGRPEILPNVEVWKVTGPRGDAPRWTAEDFEEVTVYREIRRRRSPHGSVRRAFSPDREYNNEARDRTAHLPENTGSLSDWVWCSEPSATRRASSIGC